MVEILQQFVAFSEYMNFKTRQILPFVKSSETADD